MSGHEEPARFRVDLEPMPRDGMFLDRIGTRWALHDIDPGRGSTVVGRGWALTRRGAIRKAQRVTDREARRRGPEREYLWPRGERR